MVPQCIGAFSRQPASASLSGQEAAHTILAHESDTVAAL